MKKFIIIAAFVALTEAIGTQLIFVPTNTLPGASGNFCYICICNMYILTYLVWAISCISQLWLKVSSRLKVICRGIFNNILQFTD